jgi:hypothetical protein
MNPLEWSVVAALLAFNLATLIRHFPPRFVPWRLTYLLSTSLFGHFMPRWNFFAPNPGTFDYHLLYRDRRENGLVGPWHEVRLLPTHTVVGITAFWNPRRLEVKALVDMASEISSTADELNSDPTILLGTVPYIALLTKISALPHDPESSCSQFLLLATSNGASRIIMASAYHGLSPSRDEYHRV